MAGEALKPLNSATCPKCGKAESARLGYFALHKGSVWKCLACDFQYLVPTLILAKSPKAA
jgi:ribosomal protein L37AE/L43A